MEKLWEDGVGEGVVGDLENGGEVSIEKFESIRGKGVKGEWEGKRYYGGKGKVVEEKGIRVRGWVRDEGGGVGGDWGRGCGCGEG